VPHQTTWNEANTCGYWGISTYECCLSSLRLRISTKSLLYQLSALYPACRWRRQRPNQVGFRDQSSGHGTRRLQSLNPVTLCWAVTVTAPSGSCQRRGTQLRTSHHPIAVSCKFFPTSRSPGSRLGLVADRRSCAQAGFVVFGLEYWTECYCDSALATFATPGPPSSCTLTCSGRGATDDACGGVWYANVYSATASVVTGSSLGEGYNGGTNSGVGRTGLSIGAIIGISIGGVAGLALLIALVCALACSTRGGRSNGIGTGVVYVNTQPGPVAGGGRLMPTAVFAPTLTTVPVQVVSPPSTANFSPPNVPLRPAPAASYGPGNPSPMPVSMAQLNGHSISPQPEGRPVPYYIHEAGPTHVMPRHEMPGTPSRPLADA